MIQAVHVVDVYLCNSPPKPLLLGDAADFIKDQIAEGSWVDGGGCRSGDAICPSMKYLMSM